MCCGLDLPKEGIILDFAWQVVRPDKLKDDSKNVNGQINVSCLLVSHLTKIYHIFFLCLQSKDCLFSWCKRPSAMSILLDLLTEQLSTNNTHALASSSLAVICM